MRVLCRSGHFAFYPRDASELSRYMSLYKVTLVAVDDYYTFEGISAAKSYSLEGHAYLNLTATKTHEGKPWEVFKANNFVYDLSTDSLVLKTAVRGKLSLPLSGDFYVAPNPTIQPGSVFSGGNRIMSYDGEYDFSFYQLQIMGFDYE